MTLRNLFQNALIAYGWTPVQTRSTRLVFRQAGDRHVTRLTWPDGTVTQMFDRSAWMYVGTSGGLRVGFGGIGLWRSRAALPVTRNNLLDVGRRLAAGQTPLVEIVPAALPVGTAVA